MYRGLTTSAAYPQSLSPAAISFPLRSYELAGIREPWRKTTKGLWSCPERSGAVQSALELSRALWSCPERSGAVQSALELSRALWSCP